MAERPGRSGRGSSPPPWKKLQPTAANGRTESILRRSWISTWARAGLWASRRWKTGGQQCEHGSTKGEDEGRYALERGLADDLDLLAGNCAGRVLGSGKTVEADALIFCTGQDRIQGKNDETLKCGSSYGQEEKRGPEPNFARWTCRLWSTGYRGPRSAGCRQRNAM